MRELSKILLKYVRACTAVCLSHRAIHGALGGVHGLACFLTEKPEVYAAMMALYLVMAVRG